MKLLKNQEKWKVGHLRLGCDNDPIYFVHRMKMANAFVLALSCLPFQWYFEMNAKTHWVRQWAAMDDLRRTKDFRLFEWKKKNVVHGMKSASSGSPIRHSQTVFQNGILNSEATKNDSNAEFTFWLIRLTWASADAFPIMIWFVHACILVCTHYFNWSISAQVDNAFNMLRMPWMRTLFARCNCRRWKTAHIETLSQ